MSTKLDRIAAKARQERKLCFTSLIHLITPTFLEETWRQMNRQGASGVDKETTQEFESNLGERCKNLVERLKARRYKAPPVRRVEIPKGTSGQTRSLGIPTVEDRLLQRATARILEAIYEADFLPFSYGFRPQRNPHQALQELQRLIWNTNVGTVFETDIRGFFNNLSHQWLMKMLRLRIGDPEVLRLLGKWLRAGALIDGTIERSDKGSPQGGPISPILANIYLHYALDLWYERKFRPTCRGESSMIRFADDFVAVFQHADEAARFQGEVAERLAQFGLELADEKTRLLTFGRWAERQLGQRPETFVFLGFKHVCGTSRNGRFCVVRLPSTKSCRKFLERTRTWLSRNRHRRVVEQQGQLKAMLSGFYQYFALHHCVSPLNRIWQYVLRQWFTALRKRGRPVTWAYLLAQPWFELPFPRLLHPTV